MYFGKVGTNSQPNLQSEDYELDCEFILTLPQTP